MDISRCGRAICAAFSYVIFIGTFSALGETVVSEQNGLEYTAYESPKDIPAHVFARDKELIDIKLSPDGKFLLMVVPRGSFYEARVQPTDLTDTNTYFIGHFIPSEFKGAAWGSNNRLLFITETYSWGRRWKLINNRIIYAAQHDGAAVEKLLHVTFEKSEYYTNDTILSYLPDNPNSVIVTYSDEGKEWPGIFKLDIYTGETQKISDGYKYIDDWYVDSEGKPRFGMGWHKRELRMVSRTNGNSRWNELDTASIGDSERFRFMGFNPDNPNLAYAKASHGTDRDIIYEFDLQTGALGNVVYDNGQLDAGWLVRNPHNNQLLAAYTEGDKLEKAYLDPYYEKIDRQLDRALPGRANYITQLTPDNKSALVYSISDSYAGAFYHYDFDGKTVAIFNENNPALNPDYLAKTTAISYAARDGLRIPAYLTLPQNAAKTNLPLVVMPHGGPWVRDTNEYDFWVQFIASRGYAVLRPNFRGSDGFGRKFEALGYGEWGGAMIDDIADGVTHLANEGIVDKTRVCIAGASFGGYAAIMSAIRYEDMYKCALAVAPVTDLKEWAETLDDRAGKDYYTRITGKYGRKVFKTQNPVKQAKHLRVPLVLIHGAKDYRVGVEHSQEMDKALKKAGHAPKYVELETEGHSLQLAKSRTRVLRETERLLDEYLGR